MNLLKQLWALIRKERSRFSPRLHSARRPASPSLEDLEERTLLAKTSLLAPNAIAAKTAAIYSANRLNDSDPLITRSMFAQLDVKKQGDNITGPSVIRVPNWLASGQRPNAAAQYYMYFSSHKGDYIRMAWAADIEGPWHLFNVGDTNPESVGRGVLDLDLGSDPGEIGPGNGITLEGHIASPDVFVDDVNHRIIMYFHAPVEVNGQPPTPDGEKSLVATSADGLNFNIPADGGEPGHGIQPVILGESYFRVFAHGGQLYALARGGNIYQAPAPLNPWTPPPGFDYRTELWTKLPENQNPFQADLNGDGKSNLELRHVSVRVRGDTLDVFYTRIGDAPERIFYSTIDLGVGGINQWDPTYPPQELLRPERKWEGSKDRVRESRLGSAPEKVNQLRDPYLFQDLDGKFYLFYSGRGEDAIGVAQLDVAPGVLAQIQERHGRSLRSKGSLLSSGGKKR